MSIKKYFTLLQTLDFYIRRKATGNPNQFAKRVGVSRRSILRILKELKELNIPIKFSKNRNSYYYTEEGSINKELFEKTTKLTKEEMKSVKGGMGLNIYCKEFIVTKYDTLRKDICLGYAV